MTVFATVKSRSKMIHQTDRLGSLSEKWSMVFQPVICNMVQLIKKDHKIQASSTIEVTVLKHVGRYGNNKSDSK